jgi:hypothetical protein
MHIKQKKIALLQHPFLTLTSELEDISKQFFKNPKGKTLQRILEIMALMIQDSQYIGGKLSQCHFNKATMHFQSLDHITNILGFDAHLPLFEFSSLSEMRAFDQAYTADSSEDTPLAMTYKIAPGPSAEHLGPLKPHAYLPIMPVILTSFQTLKDGHYHHALKHEAVHGIDFNTAIRRQRHPENRLLNEMIAEIGVKAESSTNHLSVDISPSFWDPYLQRIPVLSFELLDLLEVNFPTTKVSIAYALSNYTQKITTNRKNSEVTRSLLDTHQFSDVPQALNRLN